MQKVKWNTDKAKVAIKDKWGNSITIQEPFEFKTVDTKIQFICKEHGGFSRSLYQALKAKHRCPKCSPTGPKGWDFIRKQLVDRHGDRYDYSMMDNGGYESNKPLKVICKIHGVFYPHLTDHKKGSNCPACVSNSYRKTINDFLYESIKKHGNTYDYKLIFEKFKTYNDKVPIICTKHGVFEQRAGDHSRGVGCPFCKSRSKGEKEIVNYLNRVKIQFEQQKYFIDFKTDKNSFYYYDFFIPKLDTLIEYDGKQHYENTLYNNYDKSSQQKIDALKNQYAKTNSYKLIRISYKDDVEKTLIDNGL